MWHSSWLKYVLFFAFVLQGFLKITLIIEESPDEVGERGDQQGVRGAIGGAMKKVGKWAQSYKLSGVKRIFIIACVPLLYENYDNLKILLGALDIEGINFGVASDLKLINIILGMMNHKVLFLSFLNFYEAIFFCCARHSFFFKFR